MKKIILLLIIPFIGLTGNAQDKAGADKLVDEGVALHDKGEYTAAIAKYEKALELDKDNLLALAEMAYTAHTTGNYNEAINLCKKAMRVHRGHKDLNAVYVTCGNSYDALDKADKALEIYDEGIKEYPDYYHLYFNKGITLNNFRDTKGALECFQKSASLKPDHASSHNAISALQSAQGKNVPALLAACRFLVLEPQSKRSVTNLERVNTILKGSARQTGKNQITISLDAGMLSDTMPDGKPKANSFSTTEMIIMMNGALDFGKENKKKSEVEQFMRKFETVCSSLKEVREKNHGFYWEFYAPYFIEMKDKGFLETFCYIAYATSEDKDVKKWLKTHEADIEKFYEWSKNFEWKSDVK